MKGASHSWGQAFGQGILTLRTAIGLTQAELAQYLGVSRKAVGEWERNLVYPKTEHLKTFIALAITHQAFSAGREHEEIHSFWQAAHQKIPLDEDWLTSLLSQREIPAASQTPESFPGTARAYAPVEQRPRVDWGDALAVTSFYGREQELRTLTSWILEEHCRIISILGLGGIGKSTLAVHLMYQTAEYFDIVIWRSLRDAPPFDILLDECLQVLAPQALHAGPGIPDKRLDLLLESLRGNRVLLALDNLEAILEERQSTGHVRSGYEGYARLLRQLAETRHQSCLLLTSREKLGDLVSQESNRAPVHSLRLAHLDTAACQYLLAEKEVTGSASEQAQLIQMYAGNPLALKIVAQTIVDLFAGEITPFLEQGEVIFGGVRELLNEQYNRLTSLERTVLCWLAIVRESVTHNELRALLVLPKPQGEMLEAVEGLRRRSLIERGQRSGSITLQSVVQEYVTARLIVEASREIEQGNLACLIDYGLELSTVKEYIRQTQRRLLVVPLLMHVRIIYTARFSVARRLQALLSELRTKADYMQGYAPANVLALLREQHGHLRNVDLSQLTIRGASLEGVEMQDTSLADATLQDTTFTEAIDAIRAMAISSDGRYWAAGSWQGNLRIWRQNGKILHRAWQAHARTVSTLAFSPDGRTLVTGSWDGAIKLWDVESGDLLWTSWQNNTIQTIAISSDGHTLISGGNDATIQLWDARTGTHRLTLPGQSGPVYTVAWSSDGNLLASAGLDGNIRLWELQGAQPGASMRMFTGHTDWVFALAFAPDGRTLASGSFDRTVRLWEVESGDLRETLTGHINKVRAIAWSPDGRTLASCSVDQTIWLWDVEQRKYRMMLQGHTASVHALSFTPDSDSLLSGGDDGTLRVWDIASGQCVHIMQGYAVSLYDVAWSPDGTRLASAGSDKLVTIWELESLATPRLLRGHRWIVHGIAWSPDGQYIASCGWDNAIRLWNANTGTCVQLLRDPDYIDTFFYGITWSPDGKFLASGSYQSGIHVWEAASGSNHWIGHTPPTIIRRVEWHPDGTYLASCDDEGHVLLWDATDGTLKASLQGYSGMVEIVAWSPDGTRLASGGGSRGSGELIIWDVCNWQRKYTWSEENALIYALAWSPTGALLVSGDSNGTLRWWDVRKGQCIRVQQAHHGTVQSLKISPDGRLLASCGDDNFIYVWDLESGSQLHTILRDRPYERLNITGIRGVTEAQKEALHALGAFEGELLSKDKSPAHRTENDIRHPSISDIV